MSKRIPSITQKQVIANFPKRPKDSHKGQFGTVAVIGGNNGMVGAALLAGRAALKLGAGVVHVGFVANNPPGVDLLQPELMLHSAQETLALPNLDVIAIGNGLGCDLAAQKLLHDVIKRDSTLILDADALNILAIRPDLRHMLFDRQAANILTPHPGEAGRLLNISTKEVQAERISSAQDIAQCYHGSVVLKGSGSLVVTRDGKAWQNKTGNPSMSSAGMGDVLSGIIAAFVAQGMAADNALLLAVHLHGAAGDVFAEETASISMTATENIEWVRKLLNQWLTHS